MANECADTGEGEAAASAALSAGSSPARRQRGPAAPQAAPAQRGTGTFCPITGKTNLCLETRVKIFVDLKGGERGFLLSVHTIGWRSSFFLAEKNL